MRLGKALCSHVHFSKQAAKTSDASRANSLSFLSCCAIVQIGIARNDFYPRVYLCYYVFSSLPTVSPHCLLRLKVLAPVCCYLTNRRLGEPWSHELNQQTSVTVQARAGTMVCTRIRSRSHSDPVFAQSFLVPQFSSHSTWLLPPETFSNRRQSISRISLKPISQQFAAIRQARYTYSGCVLLR